MAPWRRLLPLLVIMVALVFGLWMGRVTAQTAEPGSSADPLVSKSYVDEVALFRVVNVPAGRQIIGEGGTEMVLRAGVATAITSEQGGLLDASEGVDVPHGQEIALNHLMVVPRSDGRGFQALTDLVLMVKGPAEIR